MECSHANTQFEEELMLQINDSLFRRGVIPEQVYEQAKLKIIGHRQRDSN